MGSMPVVDLGRLLLDAMTEKFQFAFFFRNRFDVCPQKKRSLVGMYSKRPMNVNCFTATVIRGVCKDNGNVLEINLAPNVKNCANLAVEMDSGI